MCLSIKINVFNSTILQFYKIYYSTFLQFYNFHFIFMLQDGKILYFFGPFMITRWRARYLSAYRSVLCIEFKHTITIILISIFENAFFIFRHLSFCEGKFKK